MTTPKLAPALLASLLASVLLAACSGGDDGDQSSGTSSARPPAKIGEPCAFTDECISDAFCSFPSGLCGVDPQENGKCQPRPSSCDGATPLLGCGCDGQIYQSVCEANRAGVELHQRGATCDTAPAGHFPCAYTFCQEGTHCKIELQGDFFLVHCLPLPDTCLPSPACACLPADPDCPCSQDAAGNLTLDCTGS